MKHSSYIDFKDYEFSLQRHILSVKPYTFAILYVLVAVFQKEQKNYETDDKIRDKKLQYDANREPEKISTLSSGKTEKREHLTCEEINF